MVTLEFEHAAGDVVMGIDEAGRGPLAGGVYAAAVTVPLAEADELLTGAWKGVNDSKKLTEKKRTALAEIIKTTPHCVWSIASASPAEIDRLNILRATHLAMRRAAAGVSAKLGQPLPPDLITKGGLFTPAPITPSPAPSTSSLAPSTKHQAPSTSSLAPSTKHQAPSTSILVDGLAVPSLPFPSTNIVKGDAKSLFIAAASILAKTARDEDCLRLETLYPGYGFAQHKGYPTAAHLAALDRLGPCPEHRMSFGPVAQMRLFPL